MLQMSKQAKAPSLSATKRAARAPSKAMVQTIGASAASLVAGTAQHTVPVAAAPAPVAAPAKPVTVALRGGLAIASVKLTAKAYRVGAAHNAAWWLQCTSAIAAGGGQASVAALVQAGVPAIFVGYVVRRGYMVAA